jgi:hypothetical protein
MKKAVYISSALILAMIFSVIIVLTNLSTVVSYALGKIIKGQVHISGSHLTCKGGTFIIDFNDILMDGNIEGQVKKWQLVIGIKRGLYLKNAIISDFDLSVKAAKGKVSFFPVPDDLLEIKRGVIIYNKQRFIINEVTIKSLRDGKQFAFEMDVRNNELFSTLRASGDGIYRGKATEAKGQLNIAGLNLNNLSDDMRGKANLNGTFTYVKKGFVFEGPFEIFDYTLKDSIFKKPFIVEKTNGKVYLMYADSIMDINISKAVFKNTPLDLNLQFVKNSLLKLELSMDFFSIQDIKNYIALDSVTKTKFDIWNNVDDGKIKINKFVYDKKHPLYMELALKNTSISYKDMHFTDVEAALSFKENQLNISGAKGVFKTSRLYDVKGVVPFSKEKDINMNGNYSFNLKDISTFIDTSGISFKNGETKGKIDLTGNKDRGFKIQGTGKFSNAYITWKKSSVSANGVYKFNNDEIIFAPLIVNRGGTDMVIRGKWHKNLLDMKIKGALDAIHMQPYIPKPSDIEGIAKLDIEVQKFDDYIKINGDISMDDLYFEFPGIAKKEKGIKSKASVKFLKEGASTRIERFLYNLDIINLDLKGNIKPDKKMDLDIAMDVFGFGRIAPLFFFSSTTTGGDLELKMSLKDIALPLKKLPYMKGYVKVNNGFLRLPWLKKPLREINLISDFNGEIFDIDINRLTCGKSILNRCTFHSAGLASPRFSLYVDMDAFDYDDFQTPDDFKISVIDKNSLMAKTSGEMSLLAKKIRFGDFNGENLNVKGLFSDSRLNISELKMNAFDGNIHTLGYIDFSGKIPHIYADSKLQRIRGGLFLKVFGEKTYMTEGRTSIYGNVDSNGSTMKELIGDMSGNVAIYSRDGLIMKWNLLSKVFGLLNVQDVLRGKVNLSKEGLQYKRMGATFTAKNGIFFTKDFLIDSPSMVITGVGSLDIKKDEIDANITVSPFVALDRTIDKIPILRNILKDKRDGFLHVAYKMKGPMNDPDISFDFANSIGGRAIEVLKNILVLPKEILESN